LWYITRVNVPTLHNMTDDQPTSLRTAAAIEWLLTNGANLSTIAQTLQTVHTWDDLTNLPLPHRIQLLGQQSATWTLPTRPPHAQTLPTNTSRHTRYQLTYPPNLAQLRRPPLLVYVKGVIPLEPAVAIATGNHPNAHGTEIVKDAVRALALTDTTLLARANTTTGIAAARHALQLGVPTTLVTSKHIGAYDSDQLLLDNIIENGGAIVSITPPGAANAITTTETDEVFIALASLIILAQIGPTEQTGLTYAKEAIRQTKPIIVTAPVNSNQPGEQTAYAASVTPMFTNTHAYDTTLLGINHQIESRIHTGQPAADAIVTDPSQFVEHIHNLARNNT
jgi:predicted Rossmann fold nucleotide-binding protein DprA/Smf involved in DNA uptake